MTVWNLLNAYDDHYFTDVVITDSASDETLANWKVSEYNDWYFGQLPYTTTVISNPLERYFKYMVKHFSMIYELNIDGYHVLYIEI